jgi:uncharacterized protein (TIGR03067 family)
MNVRWLAAVLVAMTVGSVASAQDAPKGEAGIKGKWTAKVGPNQDIPIVVDFQDGGKVEISVEAGDGQTIAISGKYKTDEAKSPKTIDFLDFMSPDGESTPDNLGIYEIKDGKLRVCTGGPGNERPTEFLPGEEGGRGTVEFTRVK